MRPDLIIAFGAMTAVTYLTRSLFTVSVTRVRISLFWERTLLALPLAVLTALVTPPIFRPQGEVILLAFNPYLIAGLFTLLLSRLTRNILISALSGMALFMILLNFYPA
jgi:branched-subunit amino acid transport protein